MKNPKRFYTYAYLREDGTPYYIGKGQAKRIYQKHGKPCGIPKDKLRIIFLKQNLTEQEAFKHEIYMIAVLGRKDLGTGILRNRTDGGEGCSGIIRKVSWNKDIPHTNETKIKISVANAGKVSYWKDKTLPKDVIEKMKLTRKLNGSSVGENNPRAKTYKVTFDNGNFIVIKSLQTWAKENGYNPNSIRNLYNGNGTMRYRDIVSVEELAQCP